MISLARYLLPKSADVLAMLRAQAESTQKGMTFFAAWAAGDEDAGIEVRALEHVADAQKRALAVALREAFSTPLDSEDIYSLSRDLDWILDLAKDTVREAELLHCEPDENAAEMAALLRDSVNHLVEALAVFQRSEGEGTKHAAEARKCARSIEKVYRRAIGSALAEEDVRVMISKRELYRQFGRIAEYVIDVAERVWFVAVKEA
jgi:uncharacterized protein Yka (UPF0111/DUF47 family)